MGIGDGEMHQLDINNDVEAEREAYAITDLNSLNWAFRKLHAIQKKESEIKSTTQREYDRIQDWELAELKKFEGDKDYFTSLIHTYHQKQLLEDPKAKTLSTPYGKSKSRSSKDKIIKYDEKILLSHVRGQDEFIKKTLRWGEFEKSLSIVDVDGEKIILDSNGAIVQGASIKPAKTTFSLAVE